MEISQPIDELGQFETSPIILKGSGLKELIDWEEQSSERLDSGGSTKNKRTYFGNIGLTKIEEMNPEP